jgi:hypothetical protein
MYLGMAVGGFTNASVADIIGLSRGTLANADRGEIGEPT